MNRQIIVNQVPGEKRIAIIEDKKLVEFSIIRTGTNNCLGNIYRGIVKRVMPGMQSAFIEFGAERTGFIYVKDLKKNISYEEFKNAIEDDQENGNGPATEENITDYLKEGQSLIVQVVKEPIGKKGARLTAHVSIPGRFAVLMPTIIHFGISKKISDPAKRDELAKLGKKVVDKGFGIILRTMAEQTSVDIVEKEIVALIKKWQEIEAANKKGKGEALLTDANDPLIEIIKNTYSENLVDIVTDTADDYKAALAYISAYIPEKKDIVRMYEMPYAIFDYYSIEVDIEKTLKKKIWLKSGGFLYVEQTEALTVIDVNTGKFLGRESLEETVLKTNMEAVGEIAYHIRLRNLAGIIIVDFIDMKNYQNRLKIIRELEAALESDPAKTSVYHFTKLGLIQITRKRTSESNISMLTETCPYCSGNGIVKSRETVSFEIIREMQRQNTLYGIKRLKVEAHPDVIFCLEQKNSEETKALIKQSKLTVDFAGNSLFHREQFVVTEMSGK